MSVEANIFIGVIEDEIRAWNEAAIRCDSLISLLTDDIQKTEWMMAAATYRHRIKILEIMIEELKRGEDNR
jgi:hypothetical protein